METRVTVRDLLQMTEEERQAVPDDVILSMGYGILYYDWCPDATPETWETMRCAVVALQARYKALDQARRRPVKQLPWIMCSCGHESQHPMSTARGTACDDCYDRMSL